VILAIGWLALAYWGYRKHSFRWWDELIFAAVYFVFAIYHQNHKAFN